MPNYKLTYFDVRARAELARLLFALGGQKYEDVRIQREKWMEIKPTTPFGQMPVLEVDGVKLCQSKTIGRFLANRFGVAGKNEIEKAQADMVVDCIADVAAPVGPMRFEQDATRKAEQRDKYGKETLPNHIKNLEKLLKENKGGDAYFVGDALTWADVAFLDLCGWVESNGFTADLSAAPKLKALKAKVEAQPKIAEWIKKRPANDF